MIKEEFINYLWQQQLFNRKNLQTETGEEVEVIHPGSLNTHSGPDFFNAQIRIKDLLWVGNVEVHIRSSDWYRHQHQHDPAYSKLILHLVWVHDQEVFLKKGDLLPVIELKGRVRRELLQDYKKLSSAKSWLACELQLPHVDFIYVRQMLDRVAVERFEAKAKRVKDLLSIHRNNWNEVLYQMLAKSFGSKVNSLPFELLAVSIPLNLVRRYLDQPLKLYALFYGQAGFLSGKSMDTYQSLLKQEYGYLRILYKLSPMEKSLWKFLRMRPSSFPTIRISQFIELLIQNEKLFSAILSTSNSDQLIKLFQIRANEYWSTHFHFGKKFRKNALGALGSSTIESILINAVIPVLFSWMKNRGLKNPASILEMLHQMKAERNHISKEWLCKGLIIRSSFDSQASLQLRYNYCELKKCLNCTIGNAILKQQK